MKVQAAPPEHFAWLEGRAGCVLTRQARAIEAVDGEGRVRGMVAYDGWTPSSVQVHVAIEAHSAARRLLGPAFEYPFQQEGRGLLLCAIPGDNARSARLVRHLGFRQTYRVLDGWAEGVDLQLYEMRRHECKWLKGA